MGWQVGARRITHANHRLTFAAAAQAEVIFRSAGSRNAEGRRDIARSQAFETFTQFRPKRAQHERGSHRDAAMVVLLPQMPVLSARPRLASLLK